MLDGKTLEQVRASDTHRQWLGYWDRDSERERQRERERERGRKKAMQRERGERGRKRERERRSVCERETERESAVSSTCYTVPASRVHAYTTVHGAAMIARD